MQQTTELARVKARIRALADKTVSNGCTEAEALAAAEMVGRLLDRYSLTMAEIDMRETACVELAVPAGGRQRRPIDGCVPAIARFCDCKVWRDRGEAGADYKFFGFEPDTLLARYLFQVIAGAIAAECALFRRHNPALRGTELRRASDSFQYGMAARLAERLEAMHATRSEAMAAQRSGGRALAVVKHQVVDAAFHETGTRLASARPAGRQVIRGAFDDGVAAGERVNLDRPLRGGQTARLE